MNNPKFLALLTILFWSFGIFLTRVISIKAPYINLSIQFFFIFLFFLFYNIAYYRRNLLQKILHIKTAYLLFGLFGYFIYFIGLFKSFALFNGASVTAILNYTFPLFTVIFRDLMFTKPKPRTFMVSVLEYSGLILGFVSILLVATRGNIHSLQITNVAGIAWGLSAGISYGIFSAYSSSVTQQDQPIFFLAATCESWILSIFLAIPEFSSIKQLPVSDYFYQAILAFVVNALGFLTWTRANRLANIMHIPISSVASLLYILPFLSLSIISFFLKETELFKPYFLISLVLLILGTYICQKSEAIYDFFL